MNKSIKLSCKSRTN